MSPQIQALLDLVNQLGPLVDANHAAAANATTATNAIVAAQAAAADAVAAAATAKKALDDKVSEIETAAEAIKGA